MRASLRFTPSSPPAPTRKIVRNKESSNNTPPHTSEERLPIRDCMAAHTRPRRDGLALGGVAGRSGVDFLRAGLLTFGEDSRLRPLALRRVGVRVATCLRFYMVGTGRVVLLAGGGGQSRGALSVEAGNGRRPWGSGRRYLGTPVHTSPSMNTHDRRWMTLGPQA